MADVRAARTEEKIGHSGRDDGGQPAPQHHPGRKERASEGGRYKGKRAGMKASATQPKRAEPFGSQGNLKPRPPEEWRRADPLFANITFRFEACEKFAAEVLRTSLSDALRMTSVGRSETKKTPPSCGGRKRRAPLKDARVRHPARTWSSFELSTCHGPSSPWPTFARRERKKKSAIPVGMTEGSPPSNIIRG